MCRKKKVGKVVRGDGEVKGGEYEKECGEVARGEELRRRLKS